RPYHERVQHADRHHGHHQHRTPQVAEREILQPEHDRLPSLSITDLPRASSLAYLRLLTEKEAALRTASVHLNFHQPVLPPNPVQRHDCHRNDEHDSRADRDKREQVTLILQVHPESQLDKHLNDRHQYQNRVSEPGTDPGRDRGERDDRQHQGQDERNDMLLRTFYPVT